MDEKQYAELLAAQSKDVLIHLLTEYTPNNPEIKNDILADLGFLNEDDEIKSIKPIIRKEIRKNKEYGYISWKGYKNIEVKASEIVALCDKRINQKYIKMPVYVLLDLLEQLSKAEQYSEVDFVDLTVIIHKKLNEYAQNLTNNNNDEAGKKLMVTSIIRYAKKKIWADYSIDDFNLLATILPLINNKNKARILKVSEELRDKNTSGFSKEQREEAFLIFMVQVFLQLGQRKQAENLLNENIDNDNIRLFKINLAYKEKEFNQAEKLTLDIINNPKHENVRYLLPWYNCLDTIYKETNQVQKRINALKKIVFLGDYSSYNLLKDLLVEDGFWEDEYPEIIENICKSFSYWELAPVLAKEKETERLFKLVRQYPELFKNYGKYIYNDYPSETTDLFKKELLSLKSMASDRKKYRKVGDFIAKYATYGDKELSLHLCEEWKRQNIRRPALQEEINNAIKTINHSR